MADTKREYLDINGLKKFWDGAKGYIANEVAPLADHAEQLADRVQTVQVVRDGNVEQIISVVDGSEASKTGDAITIDLSSFAKKADFTAYMKFEGTKTADEMAVLAATLTSADKGKVYLVTGAGSAVYVAGSEYVWTGSSFEAIGPGFDLNGYYTKSDVNTKLANEYYTNTDTDTLLGAKADQDDFDILEGRVDDLETDLDTDPIPDETINGLFS